MVTLLSPGPNGRRAGHDASVDLFEDDVDQLVEFWTVLDEDRPLIAGKRAGTALGFVLLLKFYSRYGQFPRSAADLPGSAVAYVARQIGADDADLAAYEWSGSTIEYHRTQIRAHLGFRLATVADQDRLTA